MEPLPLVTAAILAFNRRDELEVTLGKVTRELDHPADRLEVIVVDNASTDGTAAMVAERFPQVRVIQTGVNLGVPAWNRAFEAGRGDWFLVLDDDCYVEGDALRRAVDEATRRHADLVSFRVESSVPGQAFSDDYQTGVLSFWGCAALISRRAIAELGGFDPRIFLWAHELEFTLRLLNRGMAHLVLPDVSAVHMKPIPPPNPAMHARNMRHFAYVAGKHLQATDALVALASLVIRATVEVGPGDRLKSTLGLVVAGFRDGLRVRTPARPEVSRLYRRDFVEFDPHLRFVRGPVQRLRDRRRKGTLFARRNLFWDSRRALYPVDRPVTFRVP